MPQSLTIIFLFSLVLLSGCARTADRTAQQVADIVQERTGAAVDRCGYQDPQITNYILTLLDQPLTSESAIQIALLNNPEVLALYEEVNIAQADLVEAGLLTNPVFEIEVRYPHQKRLKTNIEYLVTATFLDIFLIPLRTKIASTELEQTQLRVANKLLDLTFEVRQVYIDLAAEYQILNYTQTIADLAQIESEILFKQHQVGNIYQLNYAEMQAAAAEANLNLFKSQEKIIRLKESLNRLLGLQHDFCLVAQPTLPAQQMKEYFDLCQLEWIALQERLDLQVARFELIRLSRMLGIKQWWTYSNLNVGLAGEREPDGQNLIGPGFAGALPIFNFGQAARMRLHAQLRQAQDRLAALEIHVASEVREAYRLLMTDATILTQYQQGILPIQQSILSTSEQLYNVMGLGVDRLLKNKRMEVESYRKYIESLRDYLKAKVRLDRALGGNLYRMLPQTEAEMP